MDLNVVMSLPVGGSPGLVEVQGTAERGDFSRDELTAMLDLAAGGIDALMGLQRRTIEAALS